MAGPRGELVGDAYVRIFADTRFMKRAIERDLKAAARKDADSWMDEFDKTIRESADKHLAKSRQSLVDALTGGDFDAMLKRSGNSVDDFVESIRKDIDKLQRDTEKRWTLIGKKTGNLSKDFDAARESLERWADKARVREFNEAISRSHEEALRLNRDYDTLSRRLTDARRRALDLTRGLDPAIMQRFGQKINEAFSDRNIDRINLLARSIQRVRDVTEKAAQAQRKADAEFAKMYDEAVRLNKEFDKFTQRLNESRQKATDLMKGLNNRRIRQFGKDIEDAFNARDLKRVDALGAAIKRLADRATTSHHRFTFFRRGIDNLSNSMEGMSHRGGIVADTLTAPVRLITAIGKAAAGALKPLENMGQSVGGLGGSLLTTVPGLVAMTITLGAAIAILPLFISFITLATGAVVALAGAITYGLIGAILPLGPMLLALAGGVGAVVFAIKGMDKAQRQMLSPLKDWFKSTAKTVAAHLFRNLGDDLHYVRSILTDFAGPLLVRSADALRGAGERFLAAMTGPDMDKTLDAYGVKLPKILGQLASAFGNMLTGILGFFEPVLDFGLRFSRNLNGLMKDFSRWANSARGQNSIRDFMDKAWRGAKTLWDIIKQVSRALAGLFSAGEKDGQGMLRSIDRIVKKFADWTNSKQGREDLKRWFRDARKFAGDVADAIGDIGGALGDMDTEGSRKDLLDLLHALAGLARWADRHADLMGKISDAIRFTVPVSQIAHAIKFLKNVDWRQLGWDVVNDIYDGIVAGAKKIRDFDWGGLGHDIVSGLIHGIKAALGIDTLVDDWNRYIVAPFKSLFGISSPSTLFRGFGQDIVQGLINGLRAGAGHLWSAISGAFNSFIGRVRDWAGRAVDAGARGLGRLPGRATDALKGLGSAIVSPFRSAATRAGSLALTLVNRAAGFLSRLPGRAGKAISALPGRIGGIFSTARSRAGSLASSLVSRAVALLSPLPGRARSAISGLPGRVGSVFSSAGARARALAASLVSGSVGRLSALPGRASSAISALASRVGGQFSRAVGVARSGAQRILGAIGVLGSLPGRAARLVSGVVGAISGPFRTAYSIVRGIVSSIAGLVGQAQSLASRAASIISRIPHPHLATGGIVYGRTTATIGEAGPEAVVPLNRPLSQVDPAVRALSALAQGKASTSASSEGPRRITYNTFTEGAIKVLTPAADPVIVAEQTFDRIVTGIAG